MVICCPEQFDRMSIYDLKMVCKLGHPGCEVPGHPFEIYEGRRLLQQAAIEEEENRLREEAEALNRLREEAEARQAGAVYFGWRLQPKYTEYDKRL
jgi:hypothetical protein